MYIKPTQWKSIVSVISGIITNYLIAVLNLTQCNCTIITGCGYCPRSTLIDSATYPDAIITGILVIVVVYSIWSFIQKR